MSGVKLLDPDHFLIIAHRGASGFAPEHTMEAYRLAEEMKADYIEVDLQMTRDGELVAMHDIQMDRTTDMEGLVKEHTLEEVKKADAGSYFSPEFSGVRVPALREVFEEFGTDVNYYIELKAPHEYPGVEEKLILLLEEYGLLEEELPLGKVVIQSFDGESLKRLKNMYPKLALIRLLRFMGEADLTDEELEEIRDYATGIGINYQSLNGAFVRKVREKGMLLHVYTVNRADHLERTKKLNATGAFTDKLIERV
ncbi:glycerophosphodiester phosphodiesterase family protein [Indiicoccus explosivorum]|uniref:glycerophosphodiester phosphodiesterase family protein n=1 Tax=Indiicoccus explosivorum TaxID=1917864 RepID=UPI000B435AAE|nr:glycerophosphodiester phosphodiesterase family protein [Indiicoccus explosivorum]